MEEKIYSHHYNHVAISSTSLYEIDNFMLLALVAIDRLPPFSISEFNSCHCPWPQNMIASLCYCYYLTISSALHFTSLAAPDTILSTSISMIYTYKWLAMSCFETPLLWQ